LLSRRGFEFAGALAALLAFEEFGSYVVFVAELEFSAATRANIIFYETKLVVFYFSHVHGHGSHLQLLPEFYPFSELSNPTCQRFLAEVGLPFCAVLLGFLMRNVEMYIGNGVQELPFNGIRFCAHLYLFCS